jgi:predicted phage terminase large subunit-like protein
MAAPDQTQKNILESLDAAVAISGQTRRRCEVSFREFFKQFPPAPDYLWGRHTRALAAELQAATEAVERGGTYYACVSMPPRHGKSDQISRRFPVWRLCRNPEHEIIFATYNQDQADEIARDARRCFEEAGPRWGLRFSRDQNQVAYWGIEGHKGKLRSIGIEGGATGKGAHILIIDDFYKSRSEAESETIRKRVWDAFRADLMTRRAPAHAVIVVATRWHEEDLIASIFEQMEREPDFPKFKSIKFPAQDADGGWLFPERFSPEWYLGQRATLGPYNWQSLYQGEPAPRTGRMLRADLAEVIERSQLPPLRMFRGWDLASTEKERIKDDPDYTVGTLAGFDARTGSLYVADVTRGQWSAPQRDKIIEQTARADGRGVEVRIEVVAGYKDTYTRMRALLSGAANVRPIRAEGDKVLRAAPFEPLFEAGRVKIVRGAWNRDWQAEFLAFPKGKHDDQVDSLAVAVGGEVDATKRARFSS